jgi:cytoplasmic iron level regulating protein YaaA (DUF328/UPF0246 family)
MEGVILITKSMLLIACSNSKKWDIEIPHPAFEVYDGVFYRVIKKAFSNRPEIQNRLIIYILSAKFNVIPANQRILPYDLKMLPSIAWEQRNTNTNLLKKYIAVEEPSELVVVMGKTYRDSVNWDSISIPVTFLTGSIGIMQSKLKKWLLSLSD